MSKQKLVLLILVAVLLLSLVYSFIRMPKQQSVTKLTYPSGTVAQSNQGKPSVLKKNAVDAIKGDGPLMVSLLEQNEPQFKGFKRNIFKPIFREEVKIVPLPPPPPAPPQKSILPTKPIPAAVSAAPPVAAPVDAAKQAMGRLRFLGFLRKDAQKTIFLAEGSEIFLVRKGDKIAGRYQVVGLTDEAITISVLADKSDLVFPLVENRALTVGNR